MIQGCSGFLQSEGLEQAQTADWWGPQSEWRLPEVFVSTLGMEEAMSTCILTGL